MRSRKRLLEESRLYLLIDKDTVKGPGLTIARKLARAGVGVIQLRDKCSSKENVLKEARLISKALKKSRAIFIVNDYLDIAKLSGSDGVHIGQTDTPVKEARRVLGKDKLIGVSCSNLKEALRAQNEGADYVAIGPIFRTKTKPGCRPVGIKSLRDLSRKIKIPVFAIGNINRGNLKMIAFFSIKRVALCRAILKARDTVKAAQYFAAKLKAIK